MSQINLLPWREESREQLKRDYLGKLGLMALSSTILVSLWISVAGSAVEEQQERNAYLQSSIAEMDKKVAEISELRNKKQEMIVRMKVIQDLQGTRSEIVKIFDELVRAIPDGIYLSELDRVAGQIKMSGFAESNNRISSLMRNLDKSGKYRDPNLAKVEQNDQLGIQGSVFHLQIGIEEPATDEILPIWIYSRLAYGQHR